MTIKETTMTTVLGVDIFVKAKFEAVFPTTIGDFTLKHVSSRGTVLTPEVKQNIIDVGWLCARYVFATPQTVKCDDRILDLMAQLAKQYEWTSVIKLVA